MFRRPDFTNASKEILQLFLGGVFFLPWRITLSILESIICNDIKYHWLYIEFFIQLRISLRKTAAYFKVLFFMDKRCIMEKLAYFQGKIWIYLKLHLHHLINRWVHKEKMLLVSTSILPFCFLFDVIDGSSVPCAVVSLASTLSEILTAFVA